MLTRPVFVLNWSVLIWILLFCQSVRLQKDDPTVSPLVGSNNEEYDSQTLELLPYFDNTTIISNFTTVQMGTDVFLSCRVNQLGDKVVSWLKRDGEGKLKLLTYGMDTYSSDSRKTLYFEKPNNWKLSIKTAQRSDSGQYQCQTSTHPPKILTFTLNVVSPTVEIVDDGEKPLKDKIFKTGSTLELKCIVGQIDPDLSQQHVNWYHGSRLLNNDTYRGGISVKSWLRKEFGHSKTSKLYVANVNRNDSGLYTCSMGPLKNATVFVSVGEEGVGESPATWMQHGSATNSQLPASPLLLILLVSVVVASMSISLSSPFHTHYSAVRSNPR